VSTGLFSYFQNEQNITPDAKLTFLETQLAMNPNKPSLLQAYAQASQSTPRGI